MFGRIRAWARELLAAVHAVAGAADRVAEALSEGTSEAASARLDELERRQALWEAEIDGRLMKAENERKTARAAEERTRNMVEKLGPAEGDADGVEDLPEGYADLLRGGDAPAGGEEGVQPMRQGVGSRRSRKAAARAYKFGG